MSDRPTAKLFYGYLQPESDREKDYKEDESPWEATHCKVAYGCTGEIYGYYENLCFFLAVKESLHESEWDEVTDLEPVQLAIRPSWDITLREASKQFGLDVTDQVPGWHLVCLYF